MTTPEEVSKMLNAELAKADQDNRDTKAWEKEMDARIDHAREGLCHDTPAHSA